MRFLIAIAAFVVAAVLIALGFAQRTVWAPPTQLTARADIQGQPPRYLVIRGATLNANPGQQVLTVEGGSAGPFVAYGRTADVLAWLSGQRYDELSATPGSAKLTVTPERGEALPGSKPSVTPLPTATATPGPTVSAAPGAPATPAPSASDTPTPSATPVSPVGSDLWLEQFNGHTAATTRMNVPNTVSVIIASNGTDPAPEHISVTWPLDGRTPWAGPLIVLGGAFFVAGLILYTLAVRASRASRGPRRGGRKGRGPKPPRRSREQALKPAAPGADEHHGRRALGRGLIAVPVVLAGTIALSGCTSDYWPSLGGAPTPTASSTPITTSVAGTGDNPPAVTVPQLQKILASISTTAATADKNRDAALAATRFTGAALEEREQNYAIRAKKSDYPQPDAIPSGDAQIVLPQSTNTWPRVVSTVVTGGTAAQPVVLDLVLVQQTPQDNYKVAYSIVMLGGAQVPKLAPSNIGTPSVPPDSKFLQIPPAQLAQAYSDVLARGSKSTYAGYFDESGDKLTAARGATWKAAQITAAQQAHLNLSFTDKPGDSDPVSLATISSGALVATTVDETSTSKPDTGWTDNVDPNSATAALAGKATSSKGFETDYSYQLLFYVPPAGDSGKITLLGFVQSVIGAKELP